MCSDGSYGIDEGLIASFPVRSDGALREIVSDIEINEYSREKIDISVAELREEREMVTSMGLIPG